MVGVRPIQNRQAVSAPPYLVGSVVSGSGGRLPSDVPLINGLLIRMPTGAFTSLTDMGFDSRRLNGITMPTISGVAPGTGGMGAVVQN